MQPHFEEQLELFHPRRGGGLRSPLGNLQGGANVGAGRDACEIRSGVRRKIRLPGLGGRRHKGQGEDKIAGLAGQSTALPTNSDKP